MKAFRTIDGKKCSERRCDAQCGPDGQHFHFVYNAGQPDELVAPGIWSKAVARAFYQVQAEAEDSVRSLFDVPRRLPTWEEHEAKLDADMPDSAPDDAFYVEVIKEALGLVMPPMLGVVAALASNRGQLMIFLEMLGMGEESQPEAEARNVRAEGWDISMPMVCLHGCHPIHLYFNGQHHSNESGTVRDASEARALVNGWADKYLIRPDVRRSLRTKAVRTAGHYNNELARRRGY